MRWRTLRREIRRGRSVLDNGSFFACSQRGSLFSFCYETGIMTAVRLSVVCLVSAVVGFPSIVCGQAPDSVTQSADSAAEGSSAVVQRVQTAFTEGNANRLLGSSSERVEITLFGARTHYSSAQALYVMREFFESHVPQRFRVKDVMETDATSLVRGEYIQARVAQRLEIYVRLDHDEDSDSWQLREVDVGVAPE